MINTIREEKWNKVDKEIYDATIIGGGINGSCLFHQLSQKGYKVLLVEKNDFANGTSQASAMMIWGGLLYLRNFDFYTVFKLSQDRDFLINQMENLIIPKYFRYIPSSKGKLNKYFICLALYFYWSMGLFNRRRPYSEKEFSEKSFIKSNGMDVSLLFEEASLINSDTNFVLDWITRGTTRDSLALNYCNLNSGKFQTKDKLWHLNLNDSLGNKEITVCSKSVINCAGVWTDNLNEQFKIQSSYKHVLSKGVFIGFNRHTQHNTPLIFDMGEHGDTLTYIPWGPIALWGPTETYIKSIPAGFKVEPEDLEFLLEKAHSNIESNVEISNIVSLRVGIRPLAVKKNFSKDCYPLDLSRNHAIYKDPNVPWISTYGGKLTSCISLSQKIEKQLAKIVSPNPGTSPNYSNQSKDTEWEFCARLNQNFPSVQWCIDNESCVTIEDYLRRRTNISQWTPRGGLGINDVFLSEIKKVALVISNNHSEEAENQLNNYKKKVNSEFDQIINQL